MLCCVVDRRGMLTGGVTLGSPRRPVGQMLTALERDGTIGHKRGPARSIGSPINPGTALELRLSLGHPLRRVTGRLHE